MVSLPPSLPSSFVICEKHSRGGRAPWTCQACAGNLIGAASQATGASPTLGATTRPISAPGAAPLRAHPKSTVLGARKRSHFSAVATTCERGHRHPSKVEARVCAWVYARASEGETVYRNVRLPLFALPPTDAGLPHYCNVDFATVKSGRLYWLVDAKSGRRSRDWERGRAAVEATYGLRVEETDGRPASGREAAGRKEGCDG